MNTPLEEALRLASFGFQMHPLQEKNKIPILGAWQKRATTDQAKIRLWATQYPNCNWGIQTGDKSNIIVIDIDPKNGGAETWKRLTTEYGEPDTPTVLTGSGGQHLYFLYPMNSDIKNSSNKLGKGIDVRANNGQVVSPCSIHPNGEPYIWTKDPTKITFADVPKWILDVILDDSTSAHTEIGGKLEKGTRNNDIYHNALLMFRQGAAEEFVLETMQIWLKSQDQEIPQDELLKTIHSAQKTATAKPIDMTDKSDTLNAEILLDNYGSDLIYISGLGWFYWTGKVWQNDQDMAIVSQLFMKCMKALREDAIMKMAAASDKNAVKDAATVVQWSVRSLSANAIKSAITLASTFPAVRRVPDDIDGIASLWKLNCNNGTVDLRTGQLCPHCKSDMITKLVPIDYDPEAKAPFWLSTFDLIFRGNQKLIDFMQTALGYSITGATDERCFFICWGESGANGKSTILETIQRILGVGYSQMSDMVVVTSATTDNRVSSSLAKLQGARFVSMNEAEENQKLSESLIKQLTGGDTVQACFKYQNPFEYLPAFKLWIRTNEKPIIRSQNEAIWNRVKLIPFEISIPKDKRKPRSEIDRIFDEEAPGILAWLVKGVQIWLAQKGLIDPPEVTAAIQGYRVDSDIVKLFFEECLEESASSKVKSAEVYQGFVSWCRDAGERYIMTRTKFTQRLSAIVGHDNVLRSNGQTQFAGIKIGPNGLQYTIG